MYIQSEDIYKPGVDESDLILRFSDEYAFLSNFYVSRHVLFRNDYYKASEHAYQSAKATTEEDRLEIMNAKTARDARKLGKIIEIVDNWDDIKISVMYEVLHSKFSEESLKEALLATGDKHLVEGNTWGDRFWGCEEVDGVLIGKNNLGVILMLLRDEFRNELEQG